MKKEPGTTAVQADPPRDAAHILNSILELSSQLQVTENQVMIILDALARAQDAALVSRFPAVLAICARRGIELSTSHLLGRYWESNPRQQNLERLLFVSAELFRREGITPPRNLAQIADSLKARHAPLASADILQLASGPRVAVADMQAALRTFAGDLRRSTQPPAAAKEPWRFGSTALSELMDHLFSEKQKELVFKKARGLHLTKTEREYYSRVVKKKLAAIADAEMQGLAAALCGPGARSGARRAAPARAADRASSGDGT
jgi:hypothetical protein